MCSVCVERLLTGYVLAALMVLLAACDSGQLTPEQQVRSLIDEFEAAIEAGELSRAADLVHAQYRDDRHANKGAAMRTLVAYRRRHVGVHLFTLTKTVDPAPDGQRAGALVYVAMTGSPVDSVETLLELKADLYRFDIELVREGDQWRVSRARWQRADLGVL